MTLEPPADLAKMLAEGLTSYNADEYVPLPSPCQLDFTDKKDGVTLSFAMDEFGDIKVVMDLDHPTTGYRMHLDTTITSEQMLELNSRLIKPLVDRDAEIARLSAAADAAYEAETAQQDQERAAHIAASAFRLQKVSAKGGGRSFSRLHRHTCRVLDKATSWPNNYAVTLDELMTVELPRIHERYQELVSAKEVTNNYARRARNIAFDNTVLTLCGQCKPIGTSSKFVSDELHKLAHLVVVKPTAMEDVARLLLAVENGIKETDAAYHEARA